MSSKPKDLLIGVPKQNPVQCVKGQKVIKYAWVKLSDIQAENVNWGRFRGVKGTGVRRIRSLIQTGEYDPIHYEPPVIDEDYNLIAGKHRYDAHDAEGEIYIWVAICSFVDDTARNEYALAENMRNTFKTMGSEEDFVFSISQIVKRGDISETKGGVRGYIQKNYPDLPSSFSSRMKLAEDILIEAGVDYTPIEIMSDEDIIKEYHTDYGIDINQSTDTIIRKLTGKKNLKMSDRWIRLQRDLLEGLSQGVDYTIVTTFTDANSVDIPNLRKTCSEFMTDMIANAGKLITGKQRAKVGSVKFIFTRQLPDEEIFIEEV
jgi:hypothetical protein